MPIHLGKDKKGNFVQWGHRTKYYYTANNKESLKRAKAKCQKQVGAIFANGYVGEELENSIPPVLYHATYRPLLDQIKLLGLGNTKQTMWTDSIPGIVYLADDPNVAESYAEESENIPNEDWLDDIIILKIDTNKLDLNKLFVDNNVLLDDDETNATWEYHGIIPWEYLEIYNNNYIQNNKFQMVFESVMTDTINNINDLKDFYKTIRYSLVDFKSNKCMKDIYSAMNITLSKVHVTNDNEIKILLDGVKLSEIASGSTNWNKTDSLNKIKFCIKEHYIYYFIKNNDNIIGTVSLNEYKNIVDINNFAIFKEYQFQGLGKNSLIYIINYCLDNYSNYNIQLSVAKCNKIALQLYKKLNFKIIKTNDNSYEMKLDKNEYLKNNLQILYHVSEQKLYSLNLVPRIPDNYLITCGAENKTTKRISFCPTIDSCLLALSKNLSGKELYVYAVETKNLNKNDIIIPSAKQVPDSTITHEIWVTKPVNAIVYGKINILSDDNIGREYTYNDKNVKKTAKLYGWKYKLKQYDKFEDYEKDWKLLTPTQVIQYNCGICYDTAKMNDYYLTKWNIEHKNLFACTERNYNDHDFNDPTHTFTIYLDKKDNMWKWLEGSWECFKNNTFKSKDYIELINWILKGLANQIKVTYLAAEFKKFPKYGVSLSEFGKWSTTLNYIFKQDPDGNLKQYVLDEIANILNNPSIGYGYYNPKTDQIIDDNDPNNPLPDSAFNNYRLQSYKDIVTYKLGVCWDCTLVIDKLLTLANITHLNLFLYGGGDQYTTHTTTIYTLDGKTWNWCDGSWHIFGSNDKQSNLNSKNKLDLINKINNLHEKTFKQKNDIYLIIEYPPVGCTSKEFIKYILLKSIKIQNE